MKKALLTLIVLALSVAPAFAGSWKIDTDHSAAHFRIAHLMIAEVQGSFPQVEGTAQLDEKKLANSSIDVRIDVASIDTGVEKRDAHLKSADFFDVATYPAMTFVSKAFKGHKDGSYTLKGDLTLHGVTKEVELTIPSISPVVKDPWGNLRRGAKATAQLNRKDFGIVWNATLDNGGLMIGNEVEIVIDLELIKK